MATNAKIDTTKALWDILYKVRLPYLQTTSVEYLKQFGVPTSGNKEIDKEMASQLITTYLPIVELVKHFKNGVQIRLVDHMDPKRIYDAISDHLENWKSQLTFGINIGEAPIDDLVDMDKFAHSVYEHAKYHMVDADDGSPLSKSLSRLNPFGSKSSLRASVLPSDKNKAPDIIRLSSSTNPEFKDRDSMSDFLRTSLNTTTRFKG